MPIKQISPTNAHERLDVGSDVAYLDVRTEAEFERGHPPGALNIPIVFLQAGGPAQPNPDFVAQVARVLGPDCEILVGCQSGGRSQRACEILNQAGFSNLANVEGGFGGAKDRSGAIVAAGWTDSGLPIETGQPDGRSYEDLKGASEK